MNSLNTSSHNTRYDMPYHNTSSFLLTLVTSFPFPLLQPCYKVLTATDNEHINNVAKESGHTAKMTLHAIEHSRLNLAEALKLFDSIHTHTNGKTSEILMKVLPLLRNADDARIVLYHVTNGDRLQMMQIKQAFGSLFKPLCGLYDGHYALR